MSIHCYIHVISVVLNDPGTHPFVLLILCYMIQTSTAACSLLLRLLIVCFQSVFHSNLFLYLIAQIAYCVYTTSILHQPALVLDCSDCFLCVYNQCSTATCSYTWLLRLLIVCCQSVFYINLLLHLIAQIADCVIKAVPSHTYCKLSIRTMYYHLYPF